MMRMTAMRLRPTQGTAAIMACPVPFYIHDVDTLSMQKM